MLVGLVLFTEQGWADSWQHSTSFRVATEFETNPAMLPTYKRGVWRALLDPSYTLIRSAGVNELRAGLALKIARSSNKTQSVDREDPSVFLGWRRQSDVGEFGVSAKYDEVATRATETDATGQTLVDSTRASRTISASWSKALSERSTLSADGAFEGVSYDSGTYIDYSSQSGSLNLNYILSEHSTSFLKVSGVKHIPDAGGSSSRLANAMVGLNWKTEYLDLTAQVGQFKRSGNNIGSQGSVAVKYAGQRTQLDLNVDRKISPGGLGGFVKTDHASGSWSYATSENSRTGINVGWLKNHSITDDVSRTTEVWWQHDLSLFWRVRTHYLHKTRDAVGVGSATSNIIGLSLAYARSNF